MVAFGRVWASLLVVGAICVSEATPAAAADAQGWHTWLVDGPQQVVVPPPPAAVGDAAELADLRVLIGARGAAEVERIRWWNAGGPVYRWNRIALDELLGHFVRMPKASRDLALVHAAMNDAVVTAAAAQEKFPRRRPSEQDPSLGLVLPVAPGASSYPSDFAAAASAAAGVLAYLFPDRADALRAAAEEAAQTRVLAGLAFPSDIAAGRAIGERMALLAIERGKNDGSDRKWAGEVPVGPGKWVGTNPIYPTTPTWQTWVLASADAVRPPPPPSHDSPELLAQLAELKALQRTPQMTVTAQYWEAFGGARAFALWNDEATRRILEYGLATDPPAAAQVLATLNIAYEDAAIACWDAKYAYWQIRPSQLDSELKTVFPNPNHPSYPSAHSCLTAAACTVLAKFFPADAQTFRAEIKAVNEARLWAGIHFRSDVEAGEVLGCRGMISLC